MQTFGTRVAIPALTALKNSAPEVAPKLLQAPVMPKFFPKPQQVLALPDFSLDHSAISKGHALKKHGPKEFGTSDPSQLQKHVEDTVNNFTHYSPLTNKESLYYNQNSNTVVFKDPKSKDHGTVFKPKKGFGYIQKKIQDKGSGPMTTRKKNQDGSFDILPNPK